jgi:anti-sigma regulatory factor (Ser/Thr protein kinase)
LSWLAACAAASRLPAGAGGHNGPRGGVSRRVRYRDRDVGRRAVALWVPPMLVGGTQAERLLELSLPAEPVSCARARHEIRAALQGAAVDVAAVELAVSEAVSNAVLHAYRERDCATAEPRLHLRLTEDDEGVWIVVSDDGVGMSARDDSPGLGVGLRLMANLSDQLLIVQGEIGTRVHMRFSFADTGAVEAR